MGLDVYAGTLTRYYTGNWKTRAQQWAEENGYEFSKVTPEGENVQEETVTDPAKVEEVVCAWRDFVVSQLDEKRSGTFSLWEENNTKEYYTDKPDWEAYGALILYAASKVFDETLQKNVKRNWDFGSHPLIKKALKDPEHKWSLFKGATLWIPENDPIVFIGPTPSEDNSTVSTTRALSEELSMINELVWNASEEDILSWRDTEGYPETVDEDDIKSVNENMFLDTESLAKFAYSVMYRAVNYAMENNVPIVLDY